MWGRGGWRSNAFVEMVFYVEITYDDYEVCIR